MCHSGNTCAFANNCAFNDNVPFRQQMPNRQPVASLPVTTRETADLRRAGLVADIDIILDHLQAAIAERGAIGFPSSTRSGDRRGAGEFTSTEAAAFSPDWASDWLAQAKEALQRLARVASLARAHWFPA
jgi:hypothetical protein